MASSCFEVHLRLDVNSPAELCMDWRRWGGGLQHLLVWAVFPVSWQFFSLILFAKTLFLFCIPFFFAAAVLLSHLLVCRTLTFFSWKLLQLCLRYCVVLDASFLTAIAMPLSFIEAHWKTRAAMPCASREFHRAKCLGGRPVRVQGHCQIFGPLLAGCNARGFAADGGPLWLFHSGGNFGDCFRGKSTKRLFQSKPLLFVAVPKGRMVPWRHRCAWIWSRPDFHSFIMQWRCPRRFPAAARRRLHSWPLGTAHVSFCAASRARAGCIFLSGFGTADQCTKLPFFSAETRKKVLHQRKAATGHGISLKNEKNNERK